MAQVAAAPSDLLGPSLHKQAILVNAYYIRATEQGYLPAIMLPYMQTCTRQITAIDQMNDLIELPRLRWDDDLGSSDATCKMYVLLSLLLLEWQVSTLRWVLRPSVPPCTVPRFRCVSAEHGRPSASSSAAAG